MTTSPQLDKGQRDSEKGTPSPSGALSRLYRTALLSQHASHNRLNPMNSYFSGLMKYWHRRTLPQRRGSQVLRTASLLGNQQQSTCGETLQCYSSSRQGPDGHLPQGSDLPRWSFQAYLVAPHQQWSLLKTRLKVGLTHTHFLDP